MINIARYPGVFVYGLSAFILAGCGTTAIIHTHPLLSGDLNSDAAKVYFIRSDTGFDGVADNAYTISLAGQELLTIAKGEYTLVYLKAYSGDVTVESSTVANRGGLNTWLKVRESRYFNFEKAKTYYLTFKPSLSASLQGTSYIPYNITKDIARQLAITLKPVAAAVSQPL